MLSKLFRPRWQHENPEYRKAAIAKLPPQEHSILEQLALHDPDNSVRQMAIARIDDLSMLEQLISKMTSNGDHEFATRCWALKLINSQLLSPADIEQYIIGCTNEALLAAIIAHTENESLRELALTGITNEAKLLSLMNHTKNGRAWHIIIAKLVSEDSLKEALLVVKGRDKKSQQLIKGKLDAIKSAAARQQALAEQARLLLARLEQLQKRPEDPMFEGILLAVRKQWTELSSQCESADSLKITQALEQCEKQLEANTQQKAAAIKSREESEQDSAAVAFLVQQLEWLKNDALNNNVPHELLPEKLNALNAEWDRIGKHADNSSKTMLETSRKTILRLIALNQLLNEKPYLKELNTDSIKHLSFQEVNETITGLKQILDTTHWPAVEQKPVAITAIENLLHQALNQKKKLEEHTTVLSANIKKWLHEMEQHIARKELEPAKKQQRKVRAALASLPGSAADKFSITLQRLSQAISEMDDWKDFATDPKRQFLCQEMKKLVDANIPPLHKAENIKQLQKEWKELGHCHDQSLWQEFKRHADEAYIPCQHYFDEQKQLREFNARQKTVICEQLENFVAIQSWECCDWKAIEKFHKAVQEEWQKFSPVEHHVHKTLQDRFFSALDTIKEKLESERQRNLAKLKTLVSRANQLQNTDNIQDAIAEYNHIHEQWKQVGITHRKEQQEQWQALKIIGDSLYARRQSQREEADSERRNNLSHAEEINQRILQLCTLPDQELCASRVAFEALRQAFHALDALPRHSLASHQKACQTYEDAVNNINRRNWLQQFEQLEIQANEWQKAELSGQPLLSSALTDDIPEKWKKILHQRFSTPISDQAEKNARRLCLELEILCGTATPPEDSSLKMEVQMAKLAEHFKVHSSATFDEKIEELYLRWFAQPCWDATAYAALSRRFLSTAKKALERNS